MIVQGGQMLQLETNLKRLQEVLERCLLTPTFFEMHSFL